MQSGAEPIDSTPPPPPIPEFVEWELQNMTADLRAKMTKYAEQVWFRSMPEEGQRQSWYNQLAAHKRDEEDKARIEEEKTRQQDQQKKLEQLRENRKKVQGTRHHYFAFIRLPGINSLGSVQLESPPSICQS